MTNEVDSRTRGAVRTKKKVVIVGAGIGGLAAALLLGSEDLDVTVLEKEPRPGGKLRKVAVGNEGIESGPTVLTMRWVFEALFGAAGARLEDHVRLHKAAILARHNWKDGSVFDLHADENASFDAVARLAGPAEAAGYRAFSRRMADVFETLQASFVEHPSPTIASLTRSVGLRGIGRLTRIAPFDSLWNVVGTYFSDPRLQQLFGRYATYCGASPFAAPGPLMLIAHVEQLGVWLVEGGLTRIAEATEKLAKERGVVFRYGADVSRIDLRGGRASGVRLTSGETIEADAVVFNGEPAALSGGLLGQEVRGAVSPWSAPHRSLSALTWSIRGKASGFPLSHHSVFFSGDSRAEFDDLFRRGRLPEDPTIYICAQDRDASGEAILSGVESLFLVVNAPARADTDPLGEEEILSCELRVKARLAQAGLEISALPEARVETGPSDFARMFPGSGGALYGRVSHGWASSFQRPGARTRIRGLFLAGGAVHPGPGVPMAALSGRHAASAVMAHLASTATFHPVAMPGGILTRSATTGSMP